MNVLSRTIVDTNSTRSSDRVYSAIDDQQAIPELNSLALRSLVALFDEKKQLFHRSVTLTDQGLLRHGASRRRSIFALMGLQRLQDAGESQPLNLGPIRDGILDDQRWIESAGDLGLLIWFAAVCAPDRLGRLFKEQDLGGALARYSGSRPATTTSIAWFLAGVAHARLRDTRDLPDLTDVAVEAYHLLEENQSEDGLFGHAISSGLLRRAFDTRYGTFSDQAYSIYALSIFAQAFQIEEPLGPALDCANAICDLQGDMGQWWFRYDKQSCRVVNRYPVVSMHQYGTAPASLLALGETTRQNFDKAIYRGLSWIAGANELGNDLRNLDGAAIWDSIRLEGSIPQWKEMICSLLNIPAGPRSDHLRVQYETRPDHLGWLLYAFGKFGLPRAAVPSHAAKA